MGALSIPLVDFGPFLGDDKKAQKATAIAMDDAFQTAGFVYLRNHGISQEKIDEAFKRVCNVRLSGVSVSIN